MPAVSATKKGITSVALTFNQPLNALSAGNPALYHLFKGVKKKHKTVYTKPIPIKSVTYSAAGDSATITLARPFKGLTEVALDGVIVAQDGSTSRVDYTAVVKK